MKYTCEKYPELSFYVGDRVRRFKKGVYATTDKAEQAALARIAEVKKVSTKRKGESP